VSLQYFDTVGWVFWPVKTVARITYIVLVKTLNRAQSINQSISIKVMRHIRRWISRKPLEIEAWFQRTTNGKSHMGYQMVTWPMTSRDPQRCWEAVRSAILATAWLLVPLTMVYGFFSWLMTE